MMMVDERFTIVNFSGSQNVYLYDNLTNDIVIEICTGNGQMNLLMMAACWQLLHGKDDLKLKDLLEYSEKLIKT